MDLGPHATIILSAYAITAIALSGLVAYVVLGERKQRKVLQRLEEQGIRRRSDAHRND
ncbi:MAG TPA: heme exporter protein CcmD [Hyphomicrobiales bacterium]|nr:heme exporter protein CcmD [Hyphomicrobiales bacterium]